jgi:hypothetical protein
VKRRSPQPLVALAALAGALVTSLAARATPTFPATIESDLGLAAAPPCSLCHVGPTTRASVGTPFAEALLARGVRGFDEKSLGAALAQLEAEKVDSDGDGAPDIAELRAGTDPNVSSLGGGDAGTGAPETPRYGCGAQIAPARATRTAEAALVLAVVAGLVRLGRRRARATHAGD